MFNVQCSMFNKKTSNNLAFKEKKTNLHPVKLIHEFSIHNNFANS